MAKVKIAGKTHKFTKNKKGDVIVSHPNGGGPTIDLTKKDSKIDTVSEGIAAGRQWHKTHKKKGK
jgi:hypothetical protein